MSLVPPSVKREGGERRKRERGGVRIVEREMEREGERAMKRGRERVRGMGERGEWERGKMVRMRGEGEERTRVK